MSADLKTETELKEEQSSPSSPKQHSKKRKPSITRRRTKTGCLSKSPCLLPCMQFGTLHFPSFETRCGQISSATKLRLSAVTSPSPIDDRLCPIGAIIDLAVNHVTSTHQEKTLLALYLHPRHHACKKPCASHTIDTFIPEQRLVSSDPETANICLACRHRRVKCDEAKPVSQSSQRPTRLTPCTDMS